MGRSGYQDIRISGYQGIRASGEQGVTRRLSNAEFGVRNAESEMIDGEIEKQKDEKKRICYAAVL